MGTSEKLLSLLSKDNIFGPWETFGKKFKQVVENNDHIQNFVLSGCKAVSGKPNEVDAAIASLYCFLISIILVDDMLDLDPRGDYLKIGHGQAANQALAFQSAGYRIILNSEYSEEIKLQILKILSDMIFETAYGQFLDVNIPSTEKAYWEMVRAKSSPFYSSLFQIGAIVGEASQELLDEIKSFGNIYGEMIQIHDDLVDCFETSAGPDWIQKRLPLPILFATKVNHPDQKLFIELRNNIEGDNNLIEAQKILVKCGAVSYSIDQLFPRNDKAKEIIKNNPGFEQNILFEVLNRIMEAPELLIQNFC